MGGISFEGMGGKLLDIDCCLRREALRAQGIEMDCFAVRSFSERKIVARARLIRCYEWR